jgi:hypothetical protein
VLSPILVRPVREQLEHDRIIRLLQAKYKRKFEVGINPGNEQATPVGAGPSALFPDLVLTSNERGRRLAGVVEVETVESVNNLEAMSQWAGYGRLRTAFHLYVPNSSVDVARRFCQDLQIVVTEMWAYTLIGDQFRFSLVHKIAGPPEPKASGKAAVAPAPAPRRAAKPAAPAKAPVKVAPKVAAKAAVRVAAKAAAVKKTPAKPAPKAKPVAKKATRVVTPTKKAARKTAPRSARRR